MTAASPRGPLRERAKGIVRAATFFYTVLLLCPVRYWPIAPGVDPTWVFALNTAAARGMIFGRDVAFTMGPLAYLLFPENIGNNLARGLAFQFAMWALAIAILWDLFFRGGFRLRNLVLFAVLLGLSCPLFWGSPDRTENVLLAGALILLVHFRMRGGRSRLLTALAMTGLLPFIKVTGAMLAAGALAGFVAERFRSEGRRAWREAALAVVVPGVVVAAGCGVLLRSFDAVGGYVRSNAELIGGYSAAMSLGGESKWVFAAGAETLAALAIVVAIVWRRDRGMGFFFGALVALPVFISYKHGFVRGDGDFALCFCFVSFAFGLIALAGLPEARSPARALMIALILGTLTLDGFAVPQIHTGVRADRFTGLPALPLVWHALRFGELRQTLDAEARAIPASARIEPEIRKIVQNEPVASLSEAYSNAGADSLNLTLYPVLQRYAAYTPYLDQRNAEWIRSQGPRFLIFDGTVIDGRSAWAETPAMWMEVYRWYDTRLLGARNLLLERRAQARFAGFEALADSQMAREDPLRVAPSTEPIFWTARCSLTTMGAARKLLFRVPPVTLTVHETSGRSGAFRVLPETLPEPSVGNLPSTLAEFAEVFDAGKGHGLSVETLMLGGPGISSYGPECDWNVLRAVR